jgi:spermidine synthase
MGILLAQIVWNRQLLVLVGGSTDAAAAVLAAFMLGLGTGGRFWGRRSETSSSPGALLRWITLAAAGAALLPLATGVLSAAVYPSLYSSGLPTGPVRLLISMLLVFPATFFAGGFIPVLGKLVEGRDGTLEVSRLYGLNALGSAAGGFLAGFVLLELLGAGLTLVAGFLSTALPLFLVSAPRRTGPPLRTETESRGIPGFYLILYGLSGMFALGYEMIWTRQLTYALGNSTYAFAMMGIMVLSGLGVGSLAGRRIAAAVRKPAVAFGVAEICLAVASILPLTAIRHFGSLVAVTGASGWETRTLAAFGAAMLYMLPSTACMGATFPLIVRAVARPGKLGADVGSLSFVNSLGAALGPLLVTQFLFRVAGVTPAGALLAGGSILLGFLVLLRERAVRLIVLAPAAALAAVYLTVSASPPGSVPPAGTELLFFREDRTATVSVFGRDWDGYRSLRINGVEEVPIDQASLEAFYLLGHLPWGYNPQAGNTMVVAMGGGITSGAILTHPVEELVCVELCPAVVEAAWIFAGENGRPDLDPRFRLIGDDGRNYLLGTDRSFDLIVCDATHPASADSWVLYTADFYRTVLEKLQQDGVAAQWVPLHQLPVGEFTRILATWSRTFPESAVHLAGGRHAVMIGSRQPLSLSVESIFSSPGAAAQLEAVGYSIDEPGLLQPAAGTEELGVLAATAPPSNTDDRSYCQFMARRLPADPQATIAGDVALILSMSDREDYPLYLGQMAYWDGRLPDAVDLFRNCTGSAMGRRWLAVSLTTAAEQLWMEGRGEEALPLLDEAEAADPGWERPRMLRLQIET